MTALTIISNATSRIKITVPTAVFSSTDDQIIQLRNLMNQGAKELAKGAGTDHAWTVLITEKTFTTTAAAIQTGAVPSDFGWYINETMWNRALLWPVSGPLTPQEWQAAQAIPTANIYPNFRFRGGSLLMYPTPTAGQTVAYEYVTKNWANTSGAVGIAAMTADTDVSLLDEELHSLDIVWRFKASKGLDYAEDFRTYQLELTKTIARDGGRRTQSLTGRAPHEFVGNIKEGSWP